MAARNVQGLDSVLGQPDAVRLLNRLSTQGAARGTLLFSGPEGVGKATTAVAFAQALACKAAPAKGCATCPACRRIAEGLHPDVRWLEPGGPSRSIGVDEVREEIRCSALPPHEEALRVVLLEDADRLTLPAANVFLKTLEEPSRRNLFVLITAQPARLPVTILSRCRRVRFRPLPVEVLSQLLERRGVPPDAATAAAALAGGSTTRAALLADPEALASRSEAVARLFAAASARPATVRFDASSDLADDKQAVAETLQLAGFVLRDAMVRKAGLSDKAALRGPLATLAEKEVDRRGPPLLARARAVDAARDAIEGSVAPQLALDALIVRLGGLP